MVVAIEKVSLIVAAAAAQAPAFNRRFAEKGALAHFLTRKFPLF